jgi:RNA polymerase sigma-70 factor, ECF subfamily
VSASRRERDRPLLSGNCQSEGEVAAIQTIRRSAESRFWNFCLSQMQLPTRLMSAPDMSDEAADADLMERMAAGNREAFAALFRRYHRPVFRFSAQMTGSRDAADDVTQDVFVALAQSHARYKPERGSLKAYLYGIARHLVLQREKRASSKGEVEIDTLEGDIHGVAAPFDPMDELVRAETILAVRRAIVRLPRHYREVIVLCELNGLSYDEAAHVIGCRVGTIRSRLHRARTLLEQRCRHCVGATQDRGRAPAELPIFPRRPRMISPES